MYHSLHICLLYSSIHVLYIYHRHIIYIIYNTYICLIIRFFFIFVALNKKVHKKYRYAYHYTENTEAVLRGLEKKHFKNAKETIDQVIALNDKRRSTQNELDKNLAEVNSLSRTIGQLMKEGKKEEAETARARVAELKEGNKELDAAMTQAATDMQNVLYTIPNIPYDSVPEGVGAEDNVVEKMGGMETELPKDALPHWELAKKYDLIDFDLGVKITGAGFPVYKGKGAQLQRALINFFLDEARKSGYTEIMPPTVVNAASGYGTGQLPDKEGQMYHCEVDDLYLIPTAEVPVTNIYRDVILEEKQLPIMNCAYTQCFRREAGSYGKDVRGLNRLHEFSKVELVRIDKPEHSKQSHQEMLDHVEGCKNWNFHIVSSASVVVI